MSKFCVLYDVAIPKTLSRYNTVRVNGLNTSGSILTLPPNPTTTLGGDILLSIENSQLFNLFAKIARDPELQHPRDTGEANVRNLIRLGVANVIRAFDAAQQDAKLEEIPIAPGISITLEPNVGLAESTVVEGKHNSLAQIFGIGPARTSWGAVRKASVLEPGVFSLWLEDLWIALNTIMKDEIPTQSEMYCVARTGGLYRPIVSRSERFNSGKKLAHVIFVPAQKRSLLATGSDGRLTSIGLLLGALIIMVRYQISVLPNRILLERDNADNISIGREVERTLTKIEQEAEQLGFIIKRDPNSAAESPLLDTISDDDGKKELVGIIRQWRIVRNETIVKFRHASEESVGSDLTPDAAKQTLTSVFEFLESYNRRSAAIILEEMTKRLGSDGN